MDTLTRNHIDGWSLLVGRMSGEAFSTAMAHAARTDMGEAVEIDGLEYDLCGRPIDEDVQTPAALIISISRKEGGK